MPAERPVQGAPSSFLRLDIGDGDVWSWHRRLTGACHGLAPGAAIDIVVNDEPFAVHRTGDTFGATVRLHPGRNEVLARARLDQSSVLSAAVILTGRLSPGPVARIRVTIGGDVLDLDGSASAPGEYDRAPIATWSWLLEPAGPDPQPGIATAAGANGTVLPPRADGRYRVSLTVTDGQGRSDSAAAIVEVNEGRTRLVDPFHDKPAWSVGATVYGVVVRNFGAGGFQSVIDRLDDIADLGIAALWLAPINVSPPGDFGYAIFDYFDVRPEYGTLADFRRLVDEAHARKIRVLMDVVPNHTSSDHPYFIDAQRNGDASPYRGFYVGDANVQPRHYFGWTNLPNLDFDDPDVRRFITEALMYWVRELDVDGFRVDVAWGIKERRPDYWPEFCREFYRVKPDGLLIAEASARDPYYVNSGFGSAYDWTDDLGVWAWTDAFAGERPDLATLRRALVNADGGEFDSNSFTFRFLNNNDTGPRFITTHGVGLYRVALAMLMTLPGLPCIYTGDEVGAEFEPYAAPGPIDWTDRHGLRSYHRTLIRLRHSHPALRSRGWTLLDATPGDRVLAFLRHGPDETSPLLVVLNFSPDAVDAEVPAVSTPGIGPVTTWTDVLSDTPAGIRAIALLTIPLPPWGVRVLAGEPASLPQGPQ